MKQVQSEEPRVEKAGNYVEMFDASIKGTFRDALQISLKNPGMALFIWRTLRRQKRAARRRRDCAEQGLRVPPFMIVSVTNRCNLACKGCYAQAHRRPSADEMSAAKLRRVMQEARDLGICIALIAGGEPLTRPEILDITRDFPEIIFPVFTNGLLLDRAAAARLRRQRNVVPVLSLEGQAAETDARRGAGVHQRLLETMALLHAQGIFFGISLTLTRENFETVTDRRYLEALIAAGSKLFFFVDYVPVEQGTDQLVLTDDQRQESAKRVAAFRAELPGLFIAFPGDEEEYGGCLAAGRGFIHISPEGRLEPCPFSPYSDADLQQVSLKEALQSQLLQTIRANSDQLRETKSGCALWEKREWVQSLVRAEDAGGK